MVKSLLSIFRYLGLAMFFLQILSTCLLFDWTITFIEDPIGKEFSDKHILIFYILSVLLEQ